MATVDLVRRAGHRLCGLLVLIGALWAGVGLGAESAQLRVLGYDADGTHFAFEQFGIQDGSGFPYSEIFIIDLARDSFAVGSPFRVRIDDETASLTQARAQALAAAGSALETLGVTRPAVPLVLRGDGALDDDGLTISYGIPTFGLAQTKGRYNLNLEIFKAPSGSDCSFFEGDPMGYALYAESEGVIRQVHRDLRVPTSRRCVITYKFYGVFSPFESYDNTATMAVLSIWSHGFEGPDRRFIALPVGD